MDADDATMDDAGDERANLAAFMLGRQQIHDDEEDEEAEAAALAEAAAARQQRRRDESKTGREVSNLVQVSGG